MVELYPEGVRVEQKNKGRRRWYEVYGDETVAGLELRNVSSILGVVNKPALVPWARKDAFKRVVQAAENLGQLAGITDVQSVVEMAAKLPTGGDISAKRGTELHDQIAEGLMGGSKGLDYLDEEGMEITARVQEHLDREGLRVELSEVAVYHRHLKYAGTVDLIVTNEETEKLEIIDFKTGGVWDEAALQTAAYSFAVYTLLNLPYIPACKVLKVLPEPPFTVTEFKVADIEPAINAFIGALDMDRWQRTGVKFL